ncbi:MAG: substrate-binding domain-containing protein [Acidimicrobiales bacterium]
MARRLVAFVAVLTVALPVGAFAGLASSVDSAVPAGADEPLINGGGSSYAAPAITEWASQSKDRLGLNVNYAVSSSVQGLNEFALHELNFGASEIGYSTKQADYPAPPDFQYLPDVAGATCLDYHLTAVNGSSVRTLLLDPAVMAEIFTGEIKSWNAPAIKALNPHVLLPAEPIVVAWREDPSGDNYLFSQYLNAVAPSIWQPFDKALGYYANHNFATAIWPQPNGQTIPKQYNLAGWVGESGSDNASYYVSSTEGSITYVETAYAIEHGDPCAYIKNASGNYVQPSAYNDAVALTRAQLLPDLEQELGQVYTNPDPDAYPISAYSYLLTKENGYSPQMASEFGAFILFFACYGQQSAEVLGYSPLPPILVLRDFQAVDRIAGAPKAPSAPTPANCADPYVDGSQKFPGGPQVQGGGGTTTTTIVTGTTSPGSSVTSTTIAGATGPKSGSKGKGPGNNSNSVTVIHSPGSSGSASSSNGLALLTATTGLTRASGLDPRREAALFGAAVVVLVMPPLLLSLRQRRRRRSA